MSVSDWLLSLNLARRMTAVAQSGPWRFSWRAAGLPRNLTFAEIVEEIRVHVSGGSRAASDDRATVAAERLHQKAANWSYRPSSVLGRDGLSVSNAAVAVGGLRPAYSRCLPPSCR